MTESQVISSEPIPPKRASRFFGQYVIKHRFQFKFSFVIFLFLAAATATTWFIGHQGVRHMINSGMVTDEASIQNLALINKIVAQTSILALAFAFGLAIFFSHFIAGPIYRFEKVLEEMKTGNLNIFVRLRKHDEFKETAELFNQALANLRLKVQKERDVLNISLERLKEVSAKLKKEGHAAESTELDHLLTDIKNSPPQIKI